MQEEILNKLHTALYHVSPLTADRERIIEQTGEVIWLETLEKMLTLVGEEERARAVSCINDNKMEEAMEIFEEANVDIEKIMVEVSVDVMKEVTGEE